MSESMNWLVLLLLWRTFLFVRRKVLVIYEGTVS